MSQMHQFQHPIMSSPHPLQPLPLLMPMPCPAPRLPLLSLPTPPHSLTHQVSDTWKKGQGLVSGGRLVEGSRPSGQVCDDKTFAYSVRLGPFTSCGSYRVSDTPHTREK
jgi:hypothetical protein